MSDWFVIYTYVKESPLYVGPVAVELRKRFRSLRMIDTTQIQTAAIVFPIIVLITNFAISSVTDADGRNYRIFVGGIGILGLVTSMIAAVLLFVGGFMNYQVLVAYRFLMAAVVIIFFLALGIMVHEISRGLDAQSDKLYVFTGISVFVGFAVVVAHLF